MPLQRFRSFEEARAALWGRTSDPAYLRRMAWVWAFSQKLCPSHLKPGVRRYRSLEEAQREREAWELS